MPENQASTNVAEIEVSGTFKGIFGVTDVKQLLEEIQAAEATNERGTKERVIKIQKVPEFMRRNGDLDQYFTPRELSIGPIHAANFRLFKKELKLQLAAYFLEKVKKEPKMVLISDFQRDIGRIKDKFDEKVIKSYTDDELVWLLFFDGCAMLGFIHCYVHQRLNLFNISNGQAALIQQDLFLLENQIPFQVLHKLMELDYDTEVRGLSSKDLAAFIHMSMVPRDLTEIKHQSESEDDHCLGLLRKKVLAVPTYFPYPFENLLTRTCNFFCLSRCRGGVALKCCGMEMGHSNKLDKLPEHRCKKHAFRNIKELQAAGIKFKRTNSIRNICFHSKCCITGKLELPTLVVDNWTPHLLLNLVAYEMCFPNTQIAKEDDRDDIKNSWVTSYVNLLDLLIDDEQDVKVLRAAGILRNHLSSDGEVAQLINKIGSYCIAPPKDMFENVKNKVGRHCRKRCAIWIAQVCHSHFSSPWSILALIAATAILGLTVAQTYYAAHPNS